MSNPHIETKFAICIHNKNYPTSLEIRKIYQVIPDTTSSKYQMIRVIDESNKDYLYPSNYFIPIELPKAAEITFSMTT
ncbi:MAG: hypothetical protein F6K22_21570 [Okeania sp. SIO2F4]|uniref:hypothetical protein n=1 Tax=Okeania sp. SIO2F4 TaxID=2607790 RepID=UPI00142CBB16|nr:hypothetical protein [Okeania sp. SIO2F4]NES05180.1 hypothetical protein [Okeania sp. SIO2F4]